MVYFYHKENNMRLTDDRYSSERSQFELALRMIRHEARTRTIRECTGLSDDRIRKLYSTYFRNAGRTTVRRRRGKSPRQIARFVKNADHQLQATTLVALFCVGLLLADRRERPGALPAGRGPMSNSGTGSAAPSKPTCSCTRAPAPEFRVGLEPVAHDLGER